MDDYADRSPSSDRGPGLYMDKAIPEAWQAAVALATVIGRAAVQRGLSTQESELIKVRTSQINGCPFCLDLHSRQARHAGVVQQKLDLLPGWRSAESFTERERAVLAVAEASTVLPLTQQSSDDLYGARSVLGDEVFAAAEWVAVAINAFNRISILSGHPVRPRDGAGDVVR